MPMYDAPKAAFNLRNLLFTFVGVVFAVIGGWKTLETLHKDGGRVHLEHLGGPLFFLLLGTVFAVLGVRLIFSEGRRRMMAERYPSRPWMARRDWAEGRIRDGGLMGALVITGMAVLWNLIVWPGFLESMKRTCGAEKLLSLIFSGLLPLLGIGFGIMALYLLLRWRKYGTSVFEMAKIPGAVGGMLEGVVWTRAFVRETDGVVVQLRSVRRWTSGAGKHRTTRTETLWEAERRVTQCPGSRSARNAIEVSFAIPDDCVPTEYISDSEEFLWELVVSARTPGIDYKAVFVVPVFAVESS